jgi:hypothetical protein
MMEKEDIKKIKDIVSERRLYYQRIESKLRKEYFNLRNQ